MAINKKLIHFNKKESFNTELANNNILNTSIVFIKDSKEIWTHGQLYATQLTAAEIEAIVANSPSVEDVLTQIAAEVTARDKAVMAEKHRAEQAEAALSSTIESEIARSTAKDEAHTAAINKEVQDRTNAIATEVTNRDAAIEVETNRALNAEQTLQTNINSANTAISNEVARATEAEQLIQTNLTTEINRAKAAEQSLDSKITDHTNITDTALALKADKSDTYTKSQVDQKVSGLYKVKGSSTFKDLPKTNAIGDTYNITNSFTLNEVVYPAGTNIVYTGNGWDALSGIFDTTALEGSIQTVADNLTKESVRAKEAESALSTSIADEVTNRTQADTAIQSNIATLTNKVNANEIKLSTIQGDYKTEGSINKALEDAKAYTNSVVSGLDSTITGSSKNVTVRVTEADGKLFNITVNQNDGAGSGLDADMLDGKQPSELNVASATKLETARTIWGQSFDGTGNVSGDVTLPKPNGVSTTYAIDFFEDTHKYLFAEGGVLKYGLKPNINTIIHSGNYSNYALPLSGGVVKGVTTINGNSKTSAPLEIETPGMNYNGYIKFASSGTTTGYLGMGGIDKPVFRSSAAINYTLWHSGNDGADSGLDADLLDGKHLSDLKIWGQSFDETGNIDGGLDVNGSVSGDFVDWYGVSWSEKDSNPTCKRIGNMAMHRSLPVQSAMKGYYIDPYVDSDSIYGEIIVPLVENNWTKVKFSASQQTSSTITGNWGGNVFVKIPEFWYTDDYEASTKTHNLKISQTAKAGWLHHKEAYVGAYEGYADETSYHSKKGKIPTVSVTREQIRAKARANDLDGNSKWNIYTYEEHRAICHLFLVEYATRNCQADVNGTLTADGFRQGGLGSGCTTGTMDGAYSFIPTGTTDSLGNGSGQVAYTASNGTTYYANRYRGIENPFGHIWKHCDDVISIYNDTTSLRTWYKCEDPSQFATNKSRAYKPICSRKVPANGYIKEIAATINCDFFAESTGGSGSTYWCDYTYNNTDTLEHCLLIGGFSTDVGKAGLFSLYSRNEVNSFGDNIGSRLTYLPWAE